MSNLNKSSYYPTPNYPYASTVSYYGDQGSRSLSQSTIISSRFPEQLYTKYFSSNDFNRKKAVIDDAFLLKIGQETFNVLLKCFFDEPEECLYKIELFDYFLCSLKTKALLIYKNFTGPSSIEDFILRAPYLEYIALYINYVLQEDRYYVKDIRTLLFQKIESMPPDTKTRRFYLEDIEKYISFKLANPEQQYTALTTERAFFLKRAILEVFTCIEILQRELDADFICSTLTRWLLIMSPLDNLQDYEFVFRLAKLLVEKASSITAESTYSGLDDMRLKTVIVDLLNILRIKYHPNDGFSGFNNLVIAIEIMETRDLHRCIEKYFIEIIQTIGAEKEPLCNIFYNLVNGNFTNSSCYLIRLLSENLKVNMLYGQLFCIFNNIIIPYSIPKLKVLRAFEENLSLCQFYFFGFAALGVTFPPSLQQDLSDVLDYYFRKCQKEYELRKKLDKYLDFLHMICCLYIEQSSEKKWFEEMQKNVEAIRKEFRMKKYDFEIQKLFEEAQSWIWHISQEDLDNKMTLTATETVHPKFKPSNKFKGIKNIGNTCYLACTMQTLFHTPKFRQMIIGLIEEAIQTSPNKSSRRIERADILRETQILFNQLDPLRPEPKCIDPKNFRESLPDQFRLAHEEQDTSEFLKIYLDQLESRLKVTSQKNLVDECFAGSLLVSLMCNKCRITKRKFEKFLDIVLNFDDCPKDESLDEIEMLKTIFFSETLTDIFCETCKTKKNETLKSVHIDKMPQYLAVTLNRFRFDKVGMKLSTPVTIYHQIDFKQIIPNSVIVPDLYNLYAVLVHTGLSAEHGHYYVLIKDRESMNGWYMLNDAQCWYAEDIQLPEIFSGSSLETPYILFYEAVGNTYTPTQGSYM